MNRAALPLADAQRRLGKPGRPPLSEAQRATRAARREASRAARLAMVSPRLLDLAAAARYIGCSLWTTRGLIDAGTLQRVVIPGGPGKDLRRVLLDRQALDALIDKWAGA